MERNSQRGLIRCAGTGSVPRAAPAAFLEHHPVHDTAAAAYIALSLIFRPVSRIGKIETESLANGEFLNERLTEAGADYNRMLKAVRQICEQPLLDECRDLITRAGNILKYLTDNPEKIPAARRYIDYYQETAANVLEHYVELKKTGLSTGETGKILRSTRESISTLKSAFDLQFEKLMQNELMDMEADLKLLKKHAEIRRI